MKNPALKWELIGIAVISLLGSGFHFLFEATGSWPPVGAFAAVNESVFEHLKLTFWPTVIYSAAIYKLVKGAAHNYFLAKAIALYIMPLTIIVLFYGYTTLTGLENVIIDILIFFVAVACGQLAGYRVMKIHPLPKWLTGFSVACIIALAAVYGLFTFYPPHVSFFMDSNTGTYGIP
jgi:Family of unknown function (DUF6512)